MEMLHVLICRVCGLREEGWAEPGSENVLRACLRCKCDTNHSLEMGGTKSRWRYCDATPPGGK